MNVVNVILLDRIANLGDLGEEVSVKSGFARNYLIPQGKAVRATKENRDVFEARRAELETVANERLGQAEARAEGLTGVAITIAAKAGDEGRLYGSVGTHDIAEALQSAGHQVDRNEVRLPEGVIRQVGEYEIDLQLHSNVTVSIQLAVVPD
jgi:large subunit ribosomal protein L9